MRYRLLILAMALAFLSVLTFQSVSYAMLQNLSKEQRNEAIQYGKRGVKTEVTDFIKEWSVNKGKDGFAFITTEFLSLAYASRQATFRRVPLNNFDIEDTLAKSSGKLVFRVTLFGSTENFARDYTAILETDGKMIHTTFWNNPIGEPYEEGEGKQAYVTDSDFYFPADGIDPDGKIILVVKDEESQSVAKFPFNLKELR